jgi:alpha-tubulin suppressor-like RCC1 family protein
MSEDSSTRLFLWGFSHTKNFIPDVITDKIIKDSSELTDESDYRIVDLPSHVYITKIATTANSVCLLSRDGRLFSWGRESGHSTNPKSPTQIEVLSSHLMTDISAGLSHFLCVTDTGRVYSWGNQEKTPKISYPLWGKQITFVAATASNSFAVENATCFVWGSEPCLYGNDSTEALTCPTPIQFESRIKSINAGVSHVGVVLEDCAYLWGSNDSGESDPTSQQSTVSRPTRMNHDIQTLALGDKFSFALLTTGNVIGWGLNSCDRLTDGNPDPCSGITSINQAWEVGSLVAGRDNAIVCTKENEMYMWGGQKKKRKKTIPKIGSDEIQGFRRCEDSRLQIKGSQYLFHSSCYSPLSLQSCDRSMIPRFHRSENKFRDELEKYFNQESPFSDLRILVGEQTIFTSKVSFPFPSFLHLLSLTPLPRRSVRTRHKK